MPSNIKDTISTVCGILMAVSGAIVAVTVSGVVLPAWVTTAAVITAAVASAVNMYLTGKNADGSTKSVQQVAQVQKQPDPVVKP